MVKYNRVNVKLSDLDLKKLKSASRGQREVTLRINTDIFDGDELPHKMLLTTRQRTKLRNLFEDNMSADIKLSKTQLSK